MRHSRAHGRKDAILEKRASCSKCNWQTSTINITNFTRRFHTFIFRIESSFTCLTNFCVNSGMLKFSEQFQCEKRLIFENCATIESCFYLFIICQNQFTHLHASCGEINLKKIKAFIRWAHLFTPIAISNHKQSKQLHVKKKINSVVCAWF